MYREKYCSVRKVSDLIFFYENLVDFNEEHLHEATLNLHTHAWIFSCLSIASVDDKQHLSEVVFSALIRFSLYITNMHHRVKQLPKSTTGMFSIAWYWVILCGARDRSCGQWAPPRQQSPAHSSHLIKTFLMKNQMPVVRQARYSPDIAPCNIWLFLPKG
jgi:hypothetical protein